MANANRPKAAQVNAAAMEKHLDSCTATQLKNYNFLILHQTPFTRKNLLIFRCVSVRESRCFSMAAAVTWAAFGRLAFAMGVSWVMFACITGYGGIINSFLSWPLFSPLSKLTYCTYLIHIDVIFLFFYSTKRPMYFSEYTIVSFVFLIFTY